MDDTPDLYRLLDIEPYGTFKFNDMLQFEWGAELIFECTYEHAIYEKPVDFRIHAKDCRDMHWRVYAHVQASEDKDMPIATLINFRLGQDRHRKPLHLLTDFFGLSVAYGELLIYKVEK